jgi:hypothetical protein
LVQFLIGPLGLFADEAKEKFFRIFFVLGVKNSTNFANFLLGEIHQIFINKKLNTQKKLKNFPPYTLCTIILSLMMLLMDGDEVVGDLIGLGNLQECKSYCE